MEIKELTLGDVLKKGDEEALMWVKPSKDEIMRPDKVIECGKTFLSVLNDTAMPVMVVALSNLENGKVLICPRDCEISLQGFTRAMLAEQLGFPVEPIQADGSDPMEINFLASYSGTKGISYIDFPKE